MNKIQRVSLFFKILFQLSLIALPIALVYFWIKYPTPMGFPDQGVIINFIPKSIEILNPLSTTTRIYGFLISLIPEGLTALMLYFLIKLFSLYEKGDIFTLKNVTYIKKIGYTLLINQLINPIYQVLITSTLTLHNPPGHRTASIELSGVDIATILISLGIILISWIMAEGCKLREEQQLTI